ncbi:hypothetical protein G039_0312065 [Pseudomonas aeruginosa VRFPA01]|nr:hypothetical protein G039_0312065 [Pseudomonas aeruginosa VRFPA01]
MDMSVALRVARRFITLPLDKRKLYLAKMQEEGVTPANLPIPEVASAFERIPLSYAQERQWFLWQMDPQSAAYNIPSALRLRGELDVEALAASLGAIVERHQSLRTVFVEDEQLDGFRQQVLASVDLPVPVTLASGDDAQAQIRAFVESETQQPFDLRNGPLLRARLLRLAADDHVLTLTIHHAAADGWSMRVLVEELIALYGARRQGIEATLPDLPIQYADYAIWQRHWLEAGERERQLEYWMARLGGGQTVLELPTDRQRPALPSYRARAMNCGCRRRWADSCRRWRSAKGRRCSCSCWPRSRRSCIATAARTTSASACRWPTVTGSRPSGSSVSSSIPRCCAPTSMRRCLSLTF